MEDLKELRKQFDINQNIQSDLEEYVQTLTDEWIDKGDTRENKLFKKIKSLYLTFSDIEFVAENFVSCFSMLDSTTSEKNIERSCKKVGIIQKQFPDNRNIASDYAFLLDMRCVDSLDVRECQKCLEIVGTLQEKFHDPEIQEYLDNIQLNYTEATKFETITEKLKSYDVALKQNPCNEQIAIRYFDTLAEYAEFCDDSEYRDFIQELEDYHDVLSAANLQYLRAKFDLALLVGGEKNTVGRLLNEIKYIYEQNPCERMAVVYAKALENASLLENSRHKIVVNRLCILYEKFPDNPQIRSSYACGLYSLVDVQGVKATETLKTLENLHHLYPDDEDVDTYYQDANNCYEFEKELMDDSPSRVNRNYDSGYTYCESTDRNCFAIIDTETTWTKRLMTIGVVIANTATFETRDYRYYILTPEIEEGGVFRTEAYLKASGIVKKCGHKEAIYDILDFLERHGVTMLFAYNVGLDKQLLPELSSFEWMDIAPLATNECSKKFILNDEKYYSSECVKRKYRVRSIVRMVSGNDFYTETHNALFDAVDELKIMQYLRYTLESYRNGVAPLINDMGIVPTSCKNRIFNCGDRIYDDRIGRGLILEIESDVVPGTEHGHKAYALFIGKGVSLIIVPFQGHIVKEI